MNMNFPTPSKRPLLLAMGMLALLEFKASAQIIYRDITDGVPSGIDFNADGTNEFDLYSEGNYIMYVGLGSSNNIHALGTAGSGWDVPNCVSAGFSIGASGNWIGMGDCSLDGWGGGNASITKNSDEYLGVRFNFVGSTDVYYGWIRLTVNDANTVSYLDYAYNSVPNQAIAAGEKDVLGSKTMQFGPHFSMGPNPLQDHLQVYSDASLIGLKYSLHSASGQLVMSGALEASPLDLSRLEKGLYMLLISDNKGNILHTQKLTKAE